MEILSVKNWGNFQQYKDREPKWIKVYRSLLMDYKYEQLTDAEFGILVKIWLLASQMDNQIPNDPSFIQRKCGLSSKPNIKKYLQLDFLISDNNVQNGTDLYKNVLREDKIREEKNRYGEFENVFLSDEELKKLKGKFPDFEQRIESLSSYIASKGKKYKSHYATILAWSKNDVQRNNKNDNYYQEWETPDYLKDFTNNIGENVK